MFQYVVPFDTNPVWSPHPPSIKDLGISTHFHDNVKIQSHSRWGRPNILEVEKKKFFILVFRLKFKSPNP